MPLQAVHGRASPLKLHQPIANNIVDDEIQHKPPLAPDVCKLDRVKNNISHAFLSSVLDNALFLPHQTNMSLPISIWGLYSQSEIKYIGYKGAKGLVHADDIEILRMCFHVLVNNLLGSKAVGVVQVKEIKMDAR